MDRNHVFGSVAAANRPVDRPGEQRERLLRVAFLVDGFAIGGTELNAVRTAEAIDRSMYDLAVLGMSRTGPLLARYAAADIPVVDVSLRGLLHPHVVPMARRVARWLRVNAIDVLHCHDKYSNMFGALAGRLARVPLLIASRRFQDFEGRRFAVGNAAAFRMAHQVLANSEGVQRLLVAEGIDEGKIAVVPNFLDDGAFAQVNEATKAVFRAELGIAPDALVIGCVARLDPIKDHASLVTAFAALHRLNPRTALVLVGDGPHRATIERHVATSGAAGAIHFAGWRSNASNLHQHFDISTLCSVAEGFPNVVIEAMAASVPVVATDVGAVRDALLDGETGFVVPPRDPTALAAALGQLVENPSLRVRFAKAGRARAREHYRRDAVLPRLYALWEKARRDGARTARR